MLTSSKLDRLTPLLESNISTLFADGLGAFFILIDLATIPLDQLAEQTLPL